MKEQIEHLDSFQSNLEEETSKIVEKYYRIQKLKESGGPSQDILATEAG